MRVVLDTNVVVSGLLQAFGPSGQIVRLVAASEWDLGSERERKLASHLRARRPGRST